MRRERQTSRNRRYRRTNVLLVLAAAALAAVLAGASGATAIAVTGTTTQVTTDVAQQIDPTLSGDVVVWTDLRLGNDDIFYRRLGGPEVQVTTSTTPQRLHDVSGDTIVYSDLTPPSATVRSYDITTGADSLVATPTSALNPRIDGARVVYEVGLPGATDVWVTDLTTGAAEPVATTAVIEQNPAISGSRVVFQRHETSSSPGDIVLFDLATGQETVLAGSSEDERRPDIDGDIVVWDVFSSEAVELDVVVHDLSTGSTTRLDRPGNQRLAHVSGDVVSFDDDQAGTPDVMLYHVPTGTTHAVATGEETQFINEIDGNRVVYTSRVAGNFDIWMYQFSVELPEIEVAPLAYDFGDVNVGSAATTIVTVSNVGAQPLVVSSLGLAPEAGPFAISAAPSLPASIAPGGTVDVQVRFSPTTTGLHSATLVIGSDDLDESAVEVALTGTGVLSQPAPEQQIAEILTFFDEAVAAGTLPGSGPGKSAAGRRTALRNMIEAAGDLISHGLIADACQQLEDARDRTDGEPSPPDFVAGAAAPELRQRIDTLRATLGCL